MTLELPILVRLEPDVEPIVLQSMEPRDDGSWLIKAHTSNGVPMRRVLTPDEFARIEVVEEAASDMPAQSVGVRGSTRRGKAARSEGGAPRQRNSRRGSVRPLRAMKAHRFSIPVVVAVALTVGAAGGFLAGYELNPAETDDRDDGLAVVTESVSISDSFDEGAGSLDGRALQGAPGISWQTQSGRFEIRNGVLVADEAPAVATIAGTGPISSIAATFEAVNPGTGLVVRYQDAENYWALTAAPDFGTWVLDRIVDGATSRVASTGYSGGDTVEVVLVGSTIQLWVEGLLRATVRDGALADSTTAGLIIARGDVEAAVDSVTGVGR